MGLIAFFAGQVPVYWYGCTVAAALVLAFLTSNLLLRLWGDKPERLWDIFLLAVPLGLVFSRVGYRVLHPGSMTDIFRGVCDLSVGGFSLYGGAVGCLLGVFLYAHFAGRPFWQLMDMLMPSVVLGLAIIQLGHFFMQLTVGMPIPPDAPNQYTIAEYIEYRYRPSGFENYEYFLPVAFYQAMLQLSVFVILLVVSLYDARSRRFVSGNIFLLGTLLCGLIRFGCGYFYLAVQPGLHWGQLLSLGVSVLALVLLFARQGCRDEWF